MARIAWTPEDGGIVASAIRDMEIRAASKGHQVHAVAGISLEGCIEAVGTERQGSFRRSAHAHCAKSDPFRGWICFRAHSLNRVVTTAANPTRLFWHEWAHIATWQGHTERFRRLLIDCGREAAI